MISKKQLGELYLRKGLSAAAIARQLRCSQGKINYWLASHSIPKRSISDAIYRKWNPGGDPFSMLTLKKTEDAILFGLGIGLYWGEGTKSSKTSVRLGNSDPRLIRKFIDFLVIIYGINRSRLRFGLQIFGDMNKERVLQFWTTYLNISRTQVYPSIVITPHRGVGNYRKKTQHGVLTLYFNNKKLRDTICRAIDDMSMGKPM